MASITAVLCCFYVLHWDSKVLHAPLQNAVWGETARGHLSVLSDNIIGQQQHKQPSCVRQNARGININSSCNLYVVLT